MPCTFSLHRGSLPLPLLLFCRAFFPARVWCLSCLLFRVCASLSRLATARLPRLQSLFVPLSSVVVCLCPFVYLPLSLSIRLAISLAASLCLCIAVSLSACGLLRACGCMQMGCFELAEECFEFLECCGCAASDERGRHLNRIITHTNK